MAEITGENGAVYFNEELTDKAVAGTITFDSENGGVQTITSSTGTGEEKINFEQKGYSVGMLVTVSGTSGAANDRTFTIKTVSCGVLTVDEAVSSGTDSGTPEFTEAEPGIPVLGFFNWALSYTGDAPETTNFDSPLGYRTYIPGIIGWTATADKHFLTANNEVDDWVGQTVEIRLFLNYVAIPSAGSPSQYWKGDTVITGMDETVPVDALVSQSISFQGDRALILKTQTDPWSCGISE